MSTEKMITIGGKPAVLIMPDLTDHFRPMYRDMNGNINEISSVDPASIDYWPGGAEPRVAQLAVYATHKKYGRVEELVRTTSFNSDGATTVSLTRILDNAAYTLSADEYLGPKPMRVPLGVEAVKVTGASTKLKKYATNPISSQGFAAANYAEVSVHLDSGRRVAAGIAYRINGSVTELVEREVMAGNTFNLYTGRDIADLEMIPINAAGDLAPAKTIQVSVKYWNIAHGDDAR